MLYLFNNRKINTLQHQKILGKSFNGTFRTHPDPFSKDKITDCNLGNFVPYLLVLKDIF